MAIAEGDPEVRVQRSEVGEGVPEFDGFQLYVAVFVEAAEKECWSVRGSAIRVIDGDTFVARLRVWQEMSATMRVRVLGVDTPELKGKTREAGLAAKKFTEQWLKR